MKKRLFSILFCLPFLFAQSQHLEIGVLIGGANYVGDLSENSGRLFLSETGFAGGLFFKYNFGSRFAARVGANYAKIKGRDTNSDDFNTRNRNLSFRSKLLELSVVGEFNLMGYQPYGMYQIFAPYIFVGIAATNFNPQANLEGQWIDLREVGTEGQGMTGFSAPYSSITFAIPFGFGVKYAISDKLNLGLEVGARPTFTDYLDDVSGNYVEFSELLTGNGTVAAALGNRSGQLIGGEPFVVETGDSRGDNLSRDWYFIAGITISYNILDNGLMGSRGRKRGGKGCKSSRF